MLEKWWVRAPLVLSLALLPLFFGSAASAERKPLPVTKARIAEAFDAAVRSRPSMDAFGALPWADGAAVYQPHWITELKNCRAWDAELLEDTLIVSWHGDADEAHKCGDGGYFVHLKLKNDRIRSAVFGEYHIVVT